MRLVLLLCLLAACHLPDPRVAGVRVRVPDTVHTVVGPVPVELVDSLSVPDPTVYVLGRFSFRERRIYIRREVTDPVQRLKIVFHEKFHVIMIESGLHNHLPAELLELMADAYAADRVAEWLRGRP